MHQDTKDLENKRPLADVSIGSDSKRQKLGYENIPIGIVSIEEMLSTQYYVDKTDHAYKLMSGVNKYIFLSRPRRFGKSLFVSTLEEIAKGNKELFQDCYIYNSGYDWKKYPVIRVDFGGKGNMTPDNLLLYLEDKLKDVASNYKLTVTGDTFQSRLENLVKNMTDLDGYANKIVVLVDEYDAPFINQSDPVIKESNRLIVRDFLTEIKSLTSSNFIKLEFITGVSAYSFKECKSGPNNLNDITLDKNYATIAGYKEEDLLQEGSVYSKKIDELAEERNISRDILIGEIRAMYNGYKFHPEDKTISVYNPLSTLMFLSRNELDNYWINTGTPTFLVNKMNKLNADINFSTQPIEVVKSNLIEHNEDNLTIEGAMFQAGYLTIKGYKNKLGQGKFRRPNEPILLEFPNDEVEDSFYDFLVPEFKKKSKSEGEKIKDKIITKLKDIDLEGFVKVIRSCMSSIPSNLSNPKHNRNEAYYHTALHCLLEGAELNPLSEHATSEGRIDIVINSLSDVTYIFELKHDQNSNTALGQIEGNNYREKFLYKDKNIVLIGLNFSSKMRNVEQKFDFVIYDEEGNQTTKDTILGNRQHVSNREVTRQRG
ncbi:AAA family ATPase [Cardinium endosymbiont of Culicoides punctatus]|uniref:AAA family ATPase n=1 Tax=Cardinium endosymbiont of Culicoides punctatus TaxID=2304601 RepID=UPI00140477ED|nr:AAA family ATPase [Cardinium endosymbiont of Culicoides punctatus]